MAQVAASTAAPAVRLLLSRARLLLQLLWMITMLNLTLNTTNVTAIYQQPTQVIIGSNTAAYGFMSSASQSAAFVFTNFSTTTTRQTESLLLTQLSNGLLDIALHTGKLTAAQQAQYPQFGQIPLLATGDVPVYTLPGMAAAFTLALRPLTLAKIYDGSVTYWNDTLIQLDNTAFATSLPYQPIIRVLNYQLTGVTTTFRYAMSALSGTTFKTLIGSTTNPPSWPLAAYATASSTGWVRGDPVGLDYINNPIYVALSTNYSIVVASMGAAIAMAAPMANMINAFGSTVSASATALLLAAEERGIDSTSTWNDCSNGQGRGAWPICGYVTALMPYDGTRTTCGGKLAALQLLTWLQSDASAPFAQANCVAVLDAQTLSNFAQPSFTCDGAALTVASMTTSAILAGSNSLGSILNTALSFYESTDSANQEYSFIIRDQMDSIAQVGSGEVGAALVQPDILTLTNPTAYNAYISSGDYRILPAVISAAVPIFNFPNGLSSLTSTTFTYPSILGNNSDTGGFVASIPVLIQIFTGRLTKWSDPTLTTTMPWLAERLQFANTSNLAFNNNITLVLCCSNSSADTSATQALALGLWTQMMRTPDFFRAAYNYEWFDLSAAASGQFSWTPYLPTLQKLTNVIMVAAESQMVQAVQATPGAIGYKAFANYTNDYTSEAKAYLFTQDAQTGTISFGVVPCTQASMLQCASLASNSTAATSGQLTINKLNNMTLQLISPYQSASCWPFSLLTAVVTLSSYSDDFIIPVSTANNTLNLVSWLLNDTLLTTASTIGGFARLNALPQLQKAIMYSLQYVQCNGENCLITLPYVWSVSSGVTAFATAVSAIGITVVLLSYAILITFRQRTSLRAASVPFLLVINTGVLFLLIACILIVQTPSKAICHSFAWMTDLGLILAFGPLFLKMYRIYKIFNRKQLKVVKLSNLRLLCYLAGLVAFDLLILCIWSATEPLQPVTTHLRTDNGVKDNQYTACNVPAAGQSYVIILGVEKAALLLFGTVMSFSTRNVSSTFNESSTVAWSIYNTILASVVVIPIIAFLASVGDTLSILELLFLFWIALSTWGLTFANKFYAVTKTEAAEQMSALESNRTMTGGFSFVSVDALSKATITQYLHALQSHVQAVKARSARLNGGTLSTYESAVHEPSKTQSTTPKANSPFSIPGQLRSTVSTEHQVIRPRPSYTAISTAVPRRSFIAEGTGTKYRPANKSVDGDTASPKINASTVYLPRVPAAVIEPLASPPNREESPLLGVPSADAQSPTSSSQG